MGQPSFSDSEFLRAFVLYVSGQRLETPLKPLSSFLLMDVNLKNKIMDSYLRRVAVALTTSIKTD
jgi:hypothetical protein